MRKRKIGVGVFVKNAELGIKFGIRLRLADCVRNVKKKWKRSLILLLEMKSHLHKELEFDIEEYKEWWIKKYSNQILCGDALIELKKIPTESIDCCITSPPYYGLRDYGIEGQIGLEPTLKEYLDRMFLITAELKRVLKKEGTLFWNHGDCYGGSGTGQKPNHKGKFTSGQFASMTTDKIFEFKNNSTLMDKCLSFQNYRLVMRMIDEQEWILRNVIIWHKPNCMPSSIKDRFTVDYEPVFFFSKSKKYWFETQYEPHKSTAEQYNKAAQNVKKYKSEGYKIATGDNIRGFKNEQNPLGRNKRCVWSIATKPFKEAHFATFPEDLIVPMVLAGCKKGGIVLDPFIGSGTTGLVAKKLGRNFLGIEINPAYVKIANDRLRQEILL